MKSKPPLLIDKNFLQGSKSSEIQRLMETRRLLMADTLFYELLSSAEPGRSRCFAKLPAIENPVDLVNHVGGLLKREIRSHRPCGKPSENLEELRFRFNHALASPNFALPTDVIEAIQEEEAQLHIEVESLLALVETVPTIFPDLLKGSDSERANLRTIVESVIADDMDGIRTMYSSLSSPPDGPALPPAELIDRHWAIYRWLQVRLLFVVDIYCRYGGTVPQHPVGRVFERLEHDVQDAQYLVLGVLEGSFATRERKLQRWFSLLCPEGDLYS